MARHRARMVTVEGAKPAADPVLTAEAIGEAVAKALGAAHRPAAPAPREAPPMPAVTATPMVAGGIPSEPVKTIVLRPMEQPRAARGPMTMKVHRSAGGLIDYIDTPMGRVMLHRGDNDLVDSITVFPKE
jgi:hypothetical protein